MNAPDDLSKLPDSGTVTLTSNTRVDGQDLRRFINAGGTIVPEGYKLFIDGPTNLGGDQIVFEKTPHGQTTTIFGPVLTVPPGTTIVGPYADGNGGSGVGIVIVDHGTLHAGNVVYRVVEIDPPPDVRGRHTWKAAAVVVARASKRQIKLKTPFPGLARTLFQPWAFGRVFFERPLQAIQFFLTEQRLEIESLDRRRKEAERAVSWATSQEGMSV